MSQLRRRSRRRPVIAMIAAALVAVLGIGYFYPPANAKVRDLFGLNDEPTISAFDEEHTVHSPDGRVTLGLPEGIRKDTLPVTFTNKPQRAASLGAMYGLSALTAPVDIHPTNKGAKLPDNQVVVSFTYDPAQLQAKGISPANLGIALYDTDLQAWIPLLDAQVDNKAHTVSAVSPHFSELALTFLDRAKQAGDAVTKFGGAAKQAASVAIDAATTVRDWYNKFLMTVLKDTFKTLIAEAPELECETGSKTIEVTKTTGIKIPPLVDGLSACFDDTSGADKKLRIRNGYGFPLLADKLPKGVNTNYQDVFENGNNSISLIKGAFWAVLGHGIVDPAEIGQVTVHKDMKQSATVTTRLDRFAVAFDIVWAFLTVIAPTKAFETAAVKAGIKPIIIKGSRAFAEASESNKSLKWITFAMSQIDCVHGTLDTATPKELFSKDTYEAAATAVRTCISNFLGMFKLNTTLTSLIDNLKIIPEVIETDLATKVETFSLGKVNTTKSSVAFARIDPMGPFVGTWKSGETTLVVKSDKTATYRWLEQDCGGPCVPGSPPKIYGSATLSGSLSGGKLTLTYRSLVYKDVFGNPPPGDTGELTPEIGSSGERLTLNSNGTLSVFPLRTNISDESAAELRAKALKKQK